MKERHSATRLFDNFYEVRVSNPSTMHSKCERSLICSGIACNLSRVTCDAAAGEIDLVMRDKHSALVFIEVRARWSKRFADAAASIGATKRARLVRAAHHYLVTWRGALPPCRFDVIAFDADQIRWLPDAFRADES